MMQLGIQPRTPFATRYKDYHVVRSHGRMYGVPDWLAHEDIGSRYGLATRPGILSARTRAELEALIDEQEGSGEVAACATTVPSYSYHEPSLESVAIEFAGWLPIYQWSGNCGKHPQFTHIANPPPGYRFTCSRPAEETPRPAKRGLLTRLRDWIRDKVHRAGLLMRPLRGMLHPVPGVSLRTRVRVTVSMMKLLFAFLRGGAELRACMRFLQSRHYQSQLLAARTDGPAFLTSMPYTYNVNPWIIEIEDPTTLFYPLIENGHTCDMQIKDSPYFPIVKTLLESEQCRGIITHMRSTARMVPTLFASETIRQKVHYAPLGVRVPPRWQKHEEDTPDLHLVFINSWCQVPENFFVRGGHDVLEAFAILRQRYPRLRLTLRTDLPSLDAHYHRLIEEGWVRVINRFLPAEEMETLLATSHIFLLPAARIHVVSLLQAMSYGLAVVASDGWGIEEYLNHERNGLVVKGRYGKVSWEDTQAGMLRENYDPMQTADPVVVDGIVQSVIRLVEDFQLRQRLGRAARQDVETRYSYEHWNEGLKGAFDKAFAPEVR